MRSHPHRIGLFRVLSLADKVGGSLAITALTLVKVSDLGGGGVWPSREIAVPAALLTLIAQASARMWRTILGAPSVWGTVHDMLDHLRDEVLGDELNDSPDYDHRATLFRWRRWLWRSPSTWNRAGWLVPVERSGYTTRKTTCEWRAGDAPSEAEAVAGVCWSNNGILVLTHDDLPDPAEEGLSPEEVEERITEYAQASYVPESWVRDRLKRADKRGAGLARYYCGIPVMVEGKPWGVIVIDSTTESLKDVEQIRKIYALAGQTLGSLLKHDGILKRG